MHCRLELLASVSRRTLSSDRKRLYDTDGILFLAEQSLDPLAYCVEIHEDFPILRDEAL